MELGQELPVFSSFQETDGLLMSMISTTGWSIAMQAMRFLSLGFQDRRNRGLGGLVS
eukprot:CAMPEP_0204226842 /NCGR_PEP_ID=MMETSP0361-20130328/85228_1 /ASSEMBLY_ACC=CAM_ASM_000343 /TAXON_ID=268821 /ORGANISM="Scrippsiella Hangoei, Strain SHTV-5" /LENGTH=56 /DNA_ID=CAMNT_0051193965 /DNA_START=314 /DNA_END=484 /DNA_ORIENTATION=-